ncbi:MAG: mechanosensitive ion channel family protein [Prolixibacteraceae bacterium]|jgi:small-conductance mechanosensitive channel|nr:mechanosensitive ion channel family protein [Prolixibacteraceae bacterium]
MIRTTSLLLVFLVLVFGSPVIADNADTIAQNHVGEALFLLKQTDSLKRADSITQVILRMQLEELRSTEVAKREKLEAELKRLVVDDSLKKEALKREVDSLKRKAKGFPVVPHRDTLFYIYTNIGSVTPSERARIINERLTELYHHFFLKTDSIYVADYGQSVDLVFQDKVLISVTDLDAMWSDKSKQEIASAYREKLLADIPVFKKDRSFLNLLKEIGLVLLIVFIQWALIRLVNFFFKQKVSTFIQSKEGVWFKGLEIRNYEILDSGKITNGALFLANLLRYVVILLQLFITVPLIFSIFPPTKRIAETLFGYILSPLKAIFMAVVNYIPELITIVIIVIVTRYILKFLRFLLSEIENEKLKVPGFFPDWARPTYNLIRLFILAFMVVVIFPYLPGSDSDVFKGVSVFLGIIFSLGSSSVIGNMMAGLVITYMRPFKIGDRIKIGDVTGDVVEKTPFVTRLKTPKKEFITIPNSNILSSNVINYSTSKPDEGVILHTTVTIGYDVPWRQVHELLISAAAKTQHISREHPPFVLQTSLDDFYVSYQLNATTNEPNMQPAIYSELHQNIQDAFNEAGVEIMSPHYRANRDGNTVTIPAGYLPGNYKAPAFRVENIPGDK